MSSVKAVHEDNQTINHLRMLDSLDRKPLEGGQGQRKNSGGLARTVSRSKHESRRSVLANDNNNSNNIRNTSIAFCALFASNLEVMLVEEERALGVKNGLLAVSASAALQLINPPACIFLHRHRQWTVSRSAVLPQLSLPHLPPPPPFTS